MLNVPDPYLNTSLARKLERIFDQVDQDLEDSPLVTNQLRQFVWLSALPSILAWAKIEVRARLQQDDVACSLAKLP